MDKKVFFSDKGVIISDSRFIAGGYIYNIADLSSVRLGVIKPPRWLAMYSIALGVVLLLTEGALFVVGGFLIVLGIMTGLFAKTCYAVILKAKTGEHKVLLDRNPDYIGQVVYALDAAMVHWGTPSRVEVDRYTQDHFGEFATGITSH
jgi:hypothetical protein